MRMIWAYSPFDPLLKEDSVSNLKWHGTQSRGAVSAYLVDDGFATKFPAEGDPDVKVWDMVMTDVSKS